MKRKQYAPFVMVGAAAILGFSIASIYVRRARYTRRERELEVAQQAWEGEGGAVILPQVAEEPVTG